MRLLPILEEYESPGIERDYLVEVVRRLFEIVGDDLNRLSTVVLMDLIANERIEMTDGFVVNDESSLIYMLGYEQAALVGACLAADSAIDFLEWKSIRAMTAADGAYVREMADLRARLSCHPNVSRVV